MAGEVRQKRIAQAILRIVSTLVLKEFGDSPVSSITLQRVKVSPDLRVATLYYTVYDESIKISVAAALDERVRFIRGAIAKELRHLRFIPEIRFRYDETVEEMMRLEQIFSEERIKREQKEHSDEDDEV